MKHLVLLIGSLSAILPFIWMLFASFKGFPEVASSTKLLPLNWTVATYVEIIGRVGFLTAFRNSAIQAIPSTLAVLLTSMAAGYVFAKYQFPGREVLFTILLATMMVPFTVVVIPLYLTMRDLGLLNKLIGIIVTSLCSTFGIFLMRQAIATIPNDYLDAARIDGASEFWIFRQVIVPLAKSAAAALAVFTFLGNWDSYLWPSVMLKTRDQQTIPIVIASLRSLFHTRYNIWAAGSMLTVVPVMLLFTIAQKQFVRGLALTGLKG